MRHTLLLLLVAVSGCTKDPASKYPYRVPQVPADIPHYAAPARVRGYDQVDPGQAQIDLHKRYLIAHREGFREAAKQYAHEGKCEFHSSAELQLDAPSEAVRGYWDGYNEFQRVIAEVPKKKGD